MAPNNLQPHSESFTTQRQAPLSSYYNIGTHIHVLRQTLQDSGSLSAALDESHIDEQWPSLRKKTARQ